MKEQIRPIYSELKGYFAVVPEVETIYDNTAISVCYQLNTTIDELNLATGQDYNKFKIKPRNVDWNRSTRTVADVLDYKNKLSGLINKIQGEFFSEEQTITNQPNTIINANQTQSQSQSITVILEFQEKILSQIPKYVAGTKERSFLEKLKASLPSVKTLTDILSNALKIGDDLGLDPATIHTLLGL